MNECFDKEINYFYMIYNGPIFILALFFRCEDVIKKDYISEIEHPIYLLLPTCYHNDGSKLFK